MNPGFQRQRRGEDGEERKRKEARKIGQGRKRKAARRKGSAYMLIGSHIAST